MDAVRRSGRVTDHSSQSAACVSECGCVSFHLEGVMLVQMWGLTNHLTKYLTPFGGLILEKLIGCQQVQSCSTFCGTWRFITVFTTAHHLYLSWARRIHSTPPYPMSLTGSLILSSSLGQSFPSGILSSGFLTKKRSCNSLILSPPPNTCHVPSLKWSPTECFERRTNHGVPHYDIFSRLSLLPPCYAPSSFNFIILKKMDFHSY